MRHLLLNLGKPGWSILPRGRAGKGRSSIVACDELPCQLPQGRGVPGHLHVCTEARRTWSEAISSWCSVASRCCAGSGAVPGDVSTPCLAATALQPVARAALMTNGPKGRTRESSINPHLAFTHRFEQQLPWAADRAAVPGDSDTPELQDSHSTHQPSTDGVLSLSCPRGHF